MFGMVAGFIEKSLSLLKENFDIQSVCVLEVWYFICGRKSTEVRQAVDFVVIVVSE